MTYKKVFLLPYLLIVTLFIGLYFTPLNLGLWGSRDIQNTCLDPAGFKTDAQEFYAIAVNLAQGKGFSLADQPTVLRGPGYIAAISLLLKLFGDSPLTHVSIIIFQLGLILGTLFLLQKIQQHLRQPPAAQWLAGILFALYLPHYLYAYQAIAEVSILFCFLSLCLLFLKERWLAAVPVCAALILIKGSFIMLPLFWFIGKAIENRTFRKPLVQCLLLYAFTFVLLSPWAYRNYQHFGRPLISSVGMGNVLYPGNNLRFDGDWQGPQDTYFASVHATYDEITADKILTKHALATMRAHPLATAQLWLKKAWRFWAVPIGFESLQKLPHQLPALLWMAYHWGLLLLGLYGITRCWQNPGVISLLSICLALYGLHIATYAIPRYHYPLFPILSIFALYGLMHLVPEFFKQFFPEQSD